MYKLRDAPGWRDDLDYARKEALRVALRDELRDGIWAAIRGNPDSWQLSRLLKALDQLGEELTPARLLQVRDDYPAEKKSEALEGMVEFLTTRG